MTEETQENNQVETTEELIEDGIHVSISHIFTGEIEVDSQIKVGLTPTSETLDICLFALLRQVEKLHPELYFKIERYLLNKAILHAEEIRNEVANDIIKQKEFVKSLLETHKEEYQTDVNYDEVLDKLDLRNKKYE